MVVGMYAPALMICTYQHSLPQCQSFCTHRRSECIANIIGPCITCSSTSVSTACNLILSIETTNRLELLQTLVGLQPRLLSS